MSVSPSSFVKQPDEIDTLEIKFKKRLDIASGEQITGHSVKGYLDNSDVTSVIIDGSFVTGTSVLVGVKVGIDSNDYKITIIITTNMQTPNGTFHKYEADIIMAVVAI